MNSVGDSVVKAMPGLGMGLAAYDRSCARQVEIADTKAKDAMRDQK